MESKEENTAKAEEQSTRTAKQDLPKEMGLESEGTESSLESEFRDRLHAANMAYQLRRPIRTTKLLSPLVVKLREVLQQEIRWSIDPIIEGQKSYNISVAEWLDDILKKIEDIQANQVEQTRQIERERTTFEH